MNPQHIGKSMNEIAPLIEGLISSGNDVEFTVTGNSMAPTFRNMLDTVILTKCDGEKLHRGQIPLYRRADGSYILHRIVKVKKDCYYMAGDNQTETEKNVPKSSVICVVKSFVRGGKVYSCNSLAFRVYSFLWMLILPLRRYVFRFVGFIKRLSKGGTK